MPMILLEAVLALELQIKSLIEGGELYDFQRKWRQAAINFHELLLGSRPEVRLQGQNVDAWPEETPHPTPTSQSSKRQQFVISVDSDSEELTNVNTPTSSQSSKKRRINPRTQESSTQNSHTNPTTPIKSQQDPPHKYGINSGGHRQAVRFTLPQIREIVANGHFIPHEIDPSVTQRLVKLSLKGWPLHLDKFLARTEELCRESIQERISHSFGQWRSTTLYKIIIALCEGLVKEAMAEQRKHAKRAVQLEQDAPTAHNHEVLGAACQKARTEMLAERRAVLVEEWVGKNPPTTPSKGSGGKWNGNNSGGRAVMVTDEQLGVDPYLSEVCLMGVSFPPSHPFSPFFYPKSKTRFPSPPSLTTKNKIQNNLSGYPRLLHLCRHTLHRYNHPIR